MQALLDRAQSIGAFTLNARHGWHSFGRVLDERTGKTFSSQSPLHAARNVVLATSFSVGWVVACAIDARDEIARMPAVLPAEPVAARGTFEAHTYGERVTDFASGDRVAIHPATDLFMMGARYGVVARRGRKFVLVQMDALRAPVRVHPRNLRVID